MFHMLKKFLEPEAWRVLTDKRKSFQGRSGELQTCESEIITGHNRNYSKVENYWMLG